MSRLPYSRHATALALFAAVTLLGCGHHAADAPTSLADVSNRTPRDTFEHGLALAQRGDLVRAEQYIAVAVRGGFPEREALPVLVEICLAASRLRAALNYLEPYLVRNPEDWALRYLAAELHHSLGNHRRAAQEAETVLALRAAHDGARQLLSAIVQERTL